MGAKELLDVPTQNAVLYGRREVRQVFASMIWWHIDLDENEIRKPRVECLMHNIL